MFPLLRSLPVIVISTVVRADTICQITVPIGLWLKNSTGPCATVKGHFILDSTADNLTEKMFSTFRGLKSIEGCLYVKGFNGTNNLSFFGNLEEVVCRKEEAAASNLTNVIFVLGPFFRTMGFHSLKRVEGPGQIILSYEKVRKPYFQCDQLLPEGEKCFSKQEMLFLARHPQFNGKMYQPCEIDDPCLKLERYHLYEPLPVDENATQDIDYYPELPDWYPRPKPRPRRPEYPYWFYRFEDIPANCSTFVGVICIIGPYDFNSYLFDKFTNLSLLIGQIHIMGTFLNRLDTVFPNLQNIYPYELPNIYNRADRYTCNDLTLPETSLPPKRAIPRKEALQIVRVRLNRFLVNMSLPSLLPTRPLDVSNPNFSDVLLPLRFYESNYFPEALPYPCGDFAQFDPENCGRFISNEIYPNEFDDTPPDSYVFESWLTAMVLTVIGVVFSLRTIILLQFSNVTACLPYSRKFIIFSIFIMTLTALESCIVYQKFFNIIDYNGNVDQILSEFDSPHLSSPLFQFVMLLLVSTKYTCLVLLAICHIDLALFYRTKNLKISLFFCILVTILASGLCIYLHSQLFITIRGRKPNYSREPRHVVYMPFIMYTQLSANRIRYYIYELLAKDYCKRKNIWTDMEEFYYYYGDRGDYNCYSVYFNRGEPNEPLMDEYIWRILIKCLANLPYLSFAIVSWYCWIFARYESYLGPALRFREHRNDKKREDGPADPSDIPLSS